MFNKKIEEVGNPVVYIFLTLAISCISYGLNEKLGGLTIFIVTFLFIFLLYYCGLSFTYLMIVFFIVGILINCSYYKISNKIDGEVRIVKVTNYSIIGMYEGKSITLKIDKKNLYVGEKYKIIGKLENIQDKSTGIVGELEPQMINKIQGDWITKLYEFKRNMYSRLEDNLGKRKAGLISSIAFGYSDYLDLEDKEDMKNLGIIHSISVSGLHVAIVYGFLRIFLGGKLGLLATIIYVIFTGYNYSSIRSFVMLACVEGGHILKRNNSSISALCLSALILIIYQPFSIFNISFHLTYLATLGIILFNKKIIDVLYKLPAKLREPLSLTFSAQVFTVPYLILIFKDFSANFIIGNLFLVPVVDLIVITGNILPLIYTFPKLFDFCSYINLIIIKIFDWVLNIIDKVSLPMFYGNEYVAFFYLFLLLSFYFVRKGYKKFIYLPLISILVIVIQIYSPILNIRYYKEGAILVSYRGERVLIANKNQIDIKRLSSVTFATKNYRQAKSVDIKGICNIKSQGKDYVMETLKEKYLLKVAGNKNETKEYDIINFNDGLTDKIFIINGEAIEVCS
ncbi:ComEC family competence protein [Clostridium puniceum]|uniref:ComEC family competence protein n=1 Tax=Clostridium puniceum TaxID=29367 RepID=A0A1S8TBD8_9CLOT|nr:ComEC/Rec2 family competence protein [Clostridium puniceum]OOM75058.1 ComEC family competence protein [Clostridium puniceum]